jgi:predicted flap endonuclease-1-like 5' DNA nuclease
MGEDMAQKAFWGVVRGFAVSVVACGAMASAPAMASHYRLPVSNLVSSSEAEQFAKVGVSTTLQLLQEVGDPARREAFAKKSGVSKDRLEALANQVDLIRFDGIGPSMVALLQASGIKNSRALATADADALHAAIVSANEANKISQAVPQPGLVAAWVAQAKRLPQVVTGL